MTPMRIKMLPGGTPPRYATNQASGLDCYATVAAKIRPLGRVLVPLGFCIELEPGTEAQVRPRSGLTLRQGLVAALGTVDADYRGEVKATIFNLSDEYQVFGVGERVCQLVIAPVLRVRLELADALSETVRGDAGYGSTGR